MVRYPALLCLLSGAVAALGFAPLSLWPLTLIGFALWLIVLHRVETVGRALWLGWVFGVGHFTINNNWIQHAFDFQSAMPPVLGYFAAVGLALYLAVYPAIGAGIAWRFRGKVPDVCYVLTAGAAWIASEWLRGTMFTGYAWDPVGVIWLPVIGIARLTTLTGTYALSGITIVASGALMLLTYGRWRFAAGVTSILGFAAISALWTTVPDTPPNNVLVRVVQPDIGQEDRSDADGERVLQALQRLSGRPGSRPRLIVWPEGVVRDFLEEGYPLYAYSLFGWSDPVYLKHRIARLLGPRDILMTGGSALSFDGVGRILGARNSVFTIDSGAGLHTRYDKAHLVPYGEYLPMRPILEPLGLARLVPGDIDFDDGPGPRSVDVPGFGRIGVQICYEIIFSGQVVDERHRPRLIFNPSNDAWFGRWGPPQHLAQARMRAIEEGLPIVRATPTGISAVIAADGRLIATIPPDTAGAIEVPIPPALQPTLFSRTGNWMAAIVAALMFAAAVALRRRAR